MDRRSFLRGSAIAVAGLPAVVASAVSAPSRGEFASVRAGSFAVGWDFEPTEVHAALVEVIDLATGKRLDHVVWCNASNGRLERLIHPYQIGANGECLTECISGNFAINRW